MKDQESGPNRAAFLLFTDLLTFAGFLYAAWTFYSKGEPDYQPMTLILVSSFIYDIGLARVPTWRAMGRDLITYFSR